MIIPELRDMAKQKLLLSLGITPDMLEGAVEDIVEFLSEKVEKWNTAYADGDQEIDDAVYDTVREILEQLNPDADILKTTYSKDETEIDQDLDRYITTNKMLSILTIKSKEMLEPFRQTLMEFADENGEVQCHLSAKIDGHGERVVFRHGDVVRATTRGRSKLGRDITSHMQKILGHVDLLESFDLIEIRGELALPKNKLGQARKFNSTVKSAFTAVSSLIKSSATLEELKLLDFIAYNVICDGLKFKSKSDVYEFLEEAGFTVPWYIGNGVELSGQTVNGEEESCTVNVRTFNRDIDEILQIAGEGLKGYPYETDGIVLSIDSTELFNEAGVSETHSKGNVALKMGDWEQKAYSAIIERIEFRHGKSKVTPVAIIQPTITRNGSTVRNVPLYNLSALSALEAYPNERIYFKYGGESGVVPCTIDGKTVMQLDDDFGTPFDIFSNNSSTWDSTTNYEDDEEVYDDEEVIDMEEYDEYDEYDE